MGWKVKALGLTVAGGVAAYIAGPANTIRFIANTASVIGSTVALVANGVDKAGNLWSSAHKSLTCPGVADRYKNHTQSDDDIPFLTWCGDYLKKQLPDNSASPGTNLPPPTPNRPDNDWTHALGDWGQKALHLLND